MPGRFNEYSGTQVIMGGRQGDDAPAHSFEKPLTFERKPVMAAIAVMAVMAMTAG